MICPGFAFHPVCKRVLRCHTRVAATCRASYVTSARLPVCRLVIVPVSTKTYRLTAAAVRPYITASTAVVVASAVSFPHGALDDVEGLAAVCKVCQSRRQLTCRVHKGTGASGSSMAHNKLWRQNMLMLGNWPLLYIARVAPA